MAIKTVGIVGAGASGLVSIKSCLEEDLQPICFERSSGVGGLWYTESEKKKDGFNYSFNSLTTNTSKEMMCLSDFPYPEEYPLFPTPRQMEEYYQKYADHFGLMKYVRLNQNVVNIVSIGSGRWKIKSENADNPDDVSETEVDALIVCSGLQSVPYMPDIPGAEEFTGELIHSQYFRRGSDYAGKTVVVLGAAFSGGDISVDCSRYAKMTYISTRRGCWVLRRTFAGKGPWDTHILSQWFNYMPECFQELYMERVIRRAVNHEALGLESDIRLYAGATIMINDSIDNQIYCGKLKVKPGIERLTKTGVVFTDGSRVDNVDALIIATGYNKRFPFIESKEIRDSMEELQLYKFIFNPDVPTLAAIGLFKGLGPQAYAYEMQSRYVVRILTGKLKLPSKDAMRKDIKEVSEINIKDHGHVHAYVLWMPYILDLARRIGVLPSFWSYIFTSPRIAMKLAFGTMYPYMFRIQGPHSWNGAMDALLAGPRKTVMATKTRASKVPYRNFLHTLAQVGLVFGVLFVAVMLGLYFKM
ncbi:dimethylaniline monooxygenase [N-oxide-forming] 2-like isoform X1 [Anneissia japonica]|uniref:dimethylaniline monooxygenase [N-oxide-forming] 2-like isoform X1 n=1 Tax=Anneissia japonica TaxID=1529436 RepID=UPI001425553C|nr:dimethylaniline monooxygenase [N-oxide-forming] 2-like isoform X1 [Anneissia japonica]